MMPYTVVRYGLVCKRRPALAKLWRKHDVSPFSIYLLFVLYKSSAWFSSDIYMERVFWFWWWCCCYCYHCDGIDVHPDVETSFCGVLWARDDLASSIFFRWNRHDTFAREEVLQWFRTHIMSCSINETPWTTEDSYRGNWYSRALLNMCFRLFYEWCVFSRK